MGSPVEIIPGWSAINEKLDSTLVQLNRLMHYYADETPPDLTDQTDDPKGKKLCVSEECLDTNMQEILSETQNRLRDFTETMTKLTGGSTVADRHREANEASEARSLADAERQVIILKNELARAQNEAKSLYKRVRECEETMSEVRTQSGSCARISSELERTKAKLKDMIEESHVSNLQKERAVIELKEIQNARQKEATARQQETAREKMQKQREVRDLKENFQREVLAATQQHLEREMELQKLCQELQKKDGIPKDAHFKTVEDMMALHQEKVQKLKAYHAEKLEECCQNHASLESEWQDKEFELRNKINAAVQEKSNYVQQLYDEHVKVQTLEAKLSGLESNLAIEKTANTQLESELKFVKVDLSLMEEKMKMGLKTQEQLQVNIANLQEEIMNLKYTHAQGLTKAEERTFAIQKTLSDVTSTCVYSEHDLHSYKTKVEELQKNVNSKQSDLLVTTIEIQKLRQEVKFLQSQLKSKDEEKRALQKNYETECNQLQTTVFKLKIEEKLKCEDIVLKTKDAMETELQRQAHQHKENTRKLQNQMRMQWEELTKQAGPGFRRMERMCKT